MNSHTRLAPTHPGRHPGALAHGFTLLEVMVSLSLGLIIVLGMLTLFVNINSNNQELAKANIQIENGRFAIQFLEQDLIHAGYWGEFSPQFDDQSLPSTVVPLDAPTAVPNPCLAYNSTNWNITYKNNLIGIPVQAYEIPSSVPSPTVPVCSSVVTHPQASTDVLVVRHVDTCALGWDTATSTWKAGSWGNNRTVWNLDAASNCEADNANKLYFQSTLCPTHANIHTGQAQAGSSTTITLSASASSTNNYYRDMVVYLTGNTGAGQMRVISAYSGATHVATLNSAWTTTPDDTSLYAVIHYQLNTGTDFAQHNRNCATVGNPPFADKRKFISNLYYIRDYAATQGDGIPTLMRSQFDLSSGTLAHQTAQPLIEGIEGFHVELGIDSLGKTGAAVRYDQGVNWQDGNHRITPTNRGDGVADGYVTDNGIYNGSNYVAGYLHCTASNPTLCGSANLSNVVLVKIYVLARNLERTPGYTDAKTYTLGSLTLGPYHDAFKRHVFSTTVRLNNISSRRESP